MPFAAEAEVTIAVPLTDPVETGGEAVTEPTTCALPVEASPPDETVALPDGVSSLDVELTPAEGAPDEIVREALAFGAAEGSLPLEVPKADVTTGNALEPLMGVRFALAETDSVITRDEAEAGGEPVGSLTASVEDSGDPDDNETVSLADLELVGTGWATGFSVALAGRGSVSDTVEETEIGTGSPAVTFETTLVTGSIGPSDELAVGAALGGGGGG